MTEMVEVSSQSFTRDLNAYGSSQQLLVNRTINVSHSAIIDNNDQANRSNNYQSGSDRMINQFLPKKIQLPNCSGAMWWIYLRRRFYWSDRRLTTISNTKSTESSCKLRMSRSSNRKIARMPPKNDDHWNDKRQYRRRHTLESVISNN